MDLRNVDQQQAKFYLGMVRWFEISGIVIFLALAIAPLLITRVSWFSYAYVITSIVALAVFSIWFCIKTHELELITRENDVDLLKEPSETQCNETIITGLRTSDLDDCAKIFVDAYQETYSEPWTLDTAKARLSELCNASPDYCFVLRINKFVAGFIVARPFAWHDGTRVWIEEIVIDKQYRGKGWGRALMQTLFERCKNNNVVGYALISKKASNAFKIYKKMGFRISKWMHLEVDSDKLS
jgi:ribosomal protein S18 acetylase RimI-like enzyme